MGFSIPGIGGAGATAAMSGASPHSTPQTKMTNLFNTIDTSTSGSISKQQFNQAFTTLNPPNRFQSLGANAIFSQLDPQNTGSVSRQNFINGMTSIINSFGHGNSAPANSPSLSISQSQQSLETLGNQVTTSSSPGTAVNKVV